MAELQIRELNGGVEETPAVTDVLAAQKDEVDGASYPLSIETL